MVYTSIQKNESQKERKSHGLEDTENEQGLEMLLM